MITLRQGIIIYFFIMFFAFAYGSLFMKVPSQEIDYSNLTINYTCPNGTVIEVNTNDWLICDTVNELHYPKEELDIKLFIS